LRYEPPRFTLYATVSLFALGPAAGIILAALVAWARSHARGESTRPVIR
jgi:hypothetical protein